MPVLSVTGLTVERSSDGAVIVDDVNFELDAGEVLGVVGESGSGKSTMALALLGFARRGARIGTGSVIIAGEDLLRLGGASLRSARQRLVAYVPQDPATALNPTLSIRTQLLEGLRGERRPAVDQAREVLREVGLPDDDAFLARRPQQLSGGQQQRIAIAMAVIARPAVIVLDEPTTGLDVSTQARVLSLVKELCEAHRIAAIYVSHDLAVVADVADQVIVMYGGQTVERSSAHSVLTAPRHPYARALLDAVPSPRLRQQLRPIPGRAPQPGDSSGGCVFRARCAFAAPACADATPPLRASAPGHLVRCIRDEVIEAEPPVRLRDRPDRPEVVGQALALDARNLVASYGAREVLHGVSLQLDPGRCLAVVGESGSGKTTLSKCLIGLHDDVSGTIELRGRQLALSARHRDALARRQLQYVSQNPYGSLNPRRSVRQSLSVAAPGGAGRRVLRQRLRESLERVELPERVLDAYPADLSGGQRQRVAIARALLADPAVLLCDEVTSALDVSVQASVIELLRALLDDGLAMVFVTHDLAVVRSIADDVLVLSDGHVVERGEVGAVLDRPVHPYTQSLLRDTLELPAASAG